MKEATGELSMTMITIIAIVAIAAIVAWLSPQIRTYIETTWNSIAHSCEDGTVWDAGTKQCVAGIDPE